MTIQHYIIHWESGAELKKIPTASIDFICADFPYNISNNKGLTKRGGKLVASDFGEWDKFKDQKTYLEWVFLICAEFKRILKPNASAVLFFSYRFWGWIGYELERKKRFSFRMPILFQKTNPLPSFKKTNFRSCYEFAVWLTNDNGDFRSPATFNFLGQAEMKSILDYRIWKGMDGEKLTNHPTEKPERLISRLIEIFTKPGQIVLDPFAGSGTTGVAAVKLWRRAISIEQDAGFVAMIKARV